eukprot:COSAG01_NODE_90_length_27307_cov_734.166458_18_plen_741_part_00
MTKCVPLNVVVPATAFKPSLCCTSAAVFPAKASLPAKVPLQPFALPALRQDYNRPAKLKPRNGLKISHVLNTSSAGFIERHKCSEHASVDASFAALDASGGPNLTVMELNYQNQKIGTRFMIKAGRVSVSFMPGRHIALRRAKALLYEELIRSLLVEVELPDMEFIVSLLSESPQGIGIFRTPGKPGHLFLVPSDMPAHTIETLEKYHRSQMLCFVFQVLSMWGTRYKHAHATRSPAENFVRYLSDRGMTWSGHAWGNKIEGTATWEQNSRLTTVGSTSQTLLDAEQLEALHIKVQQSAFAEPPVPPPPYQTCPFYKKWAQQWISGKHVADPQGKSDGSTGIVVSGDKNGILLGAQGEWGTKYARRKWCSMASCFNAARPACQSTGPINAFWYTDPWSKIAKSQPPGMFAHWIWNPGHGKSGLVQYRRVFSAKEACIFVVDGYQITGSKQWAHHSASFKWADLKHWAAVDGIPGRHHVLIAPQCSFQHCDHVGEPLRLGSIGEAMVLSASLWRGTSRPGFDVALPQLFTGIMDTESRYPYRNSVDPRDILLSFRGTIPFSNFWMDGRAIAHVYSHDPANGVLIEIGNPNKKEGWHPWECTEPHHHLDNRSYFDIIRTSNFGFAPGGGGPYSFRFLEYLAGGSIPVVTEDLVLPFQDSGIPSAVWDRCVVRVSHMETFNLGAVLRTIEPVGSGRFVSRQRACDEIWQRYFGGGSEDRLTTAVHNMFWQDLQRRINATRILL